ncbi:MAG: BamA/TamA family outer membrane protein [Polyangia bacterium]
MISRRPDPSPGPVLAFLPLLALLVAPEIAAAQDEEETPGEESDTGDEPPPPVEPGFELAGPAPEWGDGSEDARIPETLHEAEDIVPPAVAWMEEPAEPVFHGGEFEGEQQEEEIAGPSYVLEKIVVKGNRKTLRQMVLHHIALRPGEVFSADDPRLERARYRLLATGLFHDVSLRLKKGSRRGWVKLVVRVKERNTIIVKDLVAGFSEITPYGAVGVQERSLLGSSVRAGASAVVSKKQWGYRLELADDHFLDSDVGLRLSGQFVNARDFFGHEKVQVVSDGGSRDPYAVLTYDRAMLRLGTGYHLLDEYFLTVDYRYDNIRASVPVAGSHYSFGERRPIDFGHVLPGHSDVSSLTLGGVRDTRDHPVLPSEGSRTDFSVELGTEILGSDYEFSKFVLAHDTWFPLRKRHSIKLGIFLGLVMGEAPFFDQFFVGDFSAFVPSRVLGLNFAHLHSSLLDTSIEEMRYEDLAGSLNIEYSIPFYRGHRWIYGVDGFVGIGAFALASRRDLRTDPEGYSGFRAIPMDLTADLGIRVDTEFGVLVFSLANLFRLIPNVGEETAK